MTSRRIMALVSLLLVASVFIPATPSVAKATRTPVEFWEVNCLIDPGLQWVSEEGVLHIRGQLTQNTFYDPVSFEIVGSNAVVSNANLDPATFSGTLSGKFSLFYLPMSDTGTFDGSWNGKLTGGVAFTGRAVGHGTGELRGMKIKQRLVGDPANPPPPGLFTAPGFTPCEPIGGIIFDSGFVLNPRGD